jgi:hypothetical protein
MRKNGTSKVVSDEQLKGIRNKTKIHSFRAAGLKTGGFSAKQ